LQLKNSTPELSPNCTVAGELGKKGLPYTPRSIFFGPALFFLLPF